MLLVQYYSTQFLLLYTKQIRTNVAYIHTITHTFNSLQRRYNCACVAYTAHMYVILCALASILRDLAHGREWSKVNLMFFYVLKKVENYSPALQFVPISSTEQTTK